MVQKSSKNWQPSEHYKLTDTLKEIIFETQNNITVIAGPGTGKTETLAQRANYLLQTRQCRHPQRILALSFKVDSATNLKKRVELRCERHESRRFDSSTFDAFYISTVRRFVSFLPDWMDFDSNVEVMPFNWQWWDQYQKTQLSGQFFNFKPTTENPRLHIPQNLGDSPSGELLDFWNYCAKNKSIDFRMCSALAFFIISNNQVVRDLYKSTYKYLFLDEFQDTTNSQYNFIKEIFKDSDINITSVGDTNQMIMVWAGANPEIFDRQKVDFKTKIIPLTINHRSNSRIIQFINHVHQEISGDDSIDLVYEGTRSDEAAKDCLGARSFSGVSKEANFISLKINELIKVDSSLSAHDFALIIRQRAEDYYNDVKEIFDANKLSLRNEDRLITPNGIKIQDLLTEPLSELLILLIRKSYSLLDYTQKAELDQFASRLTGLNINVDRDFKKIQTFIEFTSSLIDFSDGIENSISAVISSIKPETLLGLFSQYTPMHLEKVKDSFCKLFLDSYEKFDCDVNLAINDFSGINQVKLMTIHKSKGLEFDSVFFVDFHDDTWWSLRNAVQGSDIQNQIEELNAFFVGLSRAKERLFFTKNRGNWPPLIYDIMKSSNQIYKLKDPIV